MCSFFWKGWKCNSKVYTVIYLCINLHLERKLYAFVDYEFTYMKRLYTLSSTTFSWPFWSVLGVNTHLTNLSAVKGTSQLQALTFASLVTGAVS